VGAILLQGAGGKAFCAGGDVRALCLGPRDESLQAAAVAYFRAEDTLCWQINQLRKPHVSILDGIVMGGGAGLSLNGLFRVATERSVFAMPEARIGFFPDVGASHFLNKLPGRLGVACALTGLRLRGRELRDCGVATHFVDSAQLPLLMERLGGLSATSARLPSCLGGVLREHESLEMLAEPPAESVLRKLPLINDWFGPSSVEEIERRLVAAADDRGAPHGASKYAAGLLAELRHASPTALKVSLEALTRGAWPRNALCVFPPCADPAPSAQPDAARVPEA
jgi:enoyl-CoA hydratase/carnithine racemase